MGKQGSRDGDVRGAAALNLDAKGRLAIPARHREALLAASEGSLVLTAHPHRCLLLYPVAGLAADPRPDPQGIQPRSACGVDQARAGRQCAYRGAGFGRRILIAPELREYAQFEKPSIWSAWVPISKSGARPVGGSRTIWLPEALSGDLPPGFGDLGAVTAGSAHVTVLLEEAVEALAIKADGTYVDATFGRAAIAAGFFPV